MKKILSIALVLVCVFSVFSFSFVCADAATTVEKTIVQKNIDNFVKFLKTKTYSANDKCYSFQEEDGAHEKEIYKLTYYYYEEGTICFKTTYEYFNNKVFIDLYIPQQYGGTATMDIDFRGSDGETLLAKSVIDIPNYTGNNAEFERLGGNSKDTNWEAACRTLTKNALINADEKIYKNRNELGLTAFGFTGLCRTHLNDTLVTKATMSANGKLACHWCSRIVSIPKIASVSLNATAFYYTGKAITPTVTVKDAKGKTLKKGSDYTVSYASGRTAYGKYTVKVTFKGNYSGSKVLYFTVNPAKPAVKSLAAAKKGFTLKWKKVGSVSGYQIQYSTKSDFSGAKSVTAKGANTLAKTVGSLKSGTKYYVRIRSYKAVTFSGEKVYIYSGWRTAGSVKAK
ncbi:MAG: fibronectin type III domain-containing protein [Clostridia bacterium]|nr:fibronectin type III domain-containing protein [Clostridia bacterium]